MMKIDAMRHSAQTHTHLFHIAICLCWMFVQQRAFKNHRFSQETPPLTVFDVTESNGNTIYTLHSCTLKKKKKTFIHVCPKFSSMGHNWAVIYFCINIHEMLYQRWFVVISSSRPTRRLQNVFNKQKGHRVDKWCVFMNIYVVHQSTLEQLEGFLAAHTDQDHTSAYLKCEK